MRPPAQRLVVASFAVATIGLAPGCGGDSSTTTPSDGVVQTVSVGTHTHAELFSDGSLRVIRDGQTLIERGAPVFSVLQDRDDPSGFHDPTDLDGLAFDTPKPADVSMTSSGNVLHLRLADQGADAALVSFSLPLDDGAYLGLGERFDHVDARGAVVPMFLALNASRESGTNDAHVPVPFVVSTHGYGVFVSSREAGAVDVGAHGGDALRATFEGRVMEVRLYFPEDETPLEAAALYAQDTGLPKRPPLWAFAPMHWRNEWPDSATLLGDLDAYRTLHIPASCVWIDNPWETSYNDATLDPARFGDTAALMKAIADRGFRTIAWSTPYLDKPDGAPKNTAQSLWVEANAKHYLVREADGKSWSAIGCCVSGPGMIDFTSKPGTKFWQGVLGSATGAGIAGFKLDYGEDLVPSIFGARLKLELADGETERTARHYPLLYDDAYEGALDDARDDRFVIGRASSFGGAAHIEAIWPGDLDNGFERHSDAHVGGLPAAVVAGQTLATSGFPSFGSDTGGFRDGMPKREALLRWAEHTAFSVIMQLGGGGDHHNPWLYDAKAGEIYAGLAQQHMQLVPYLDGIVRDAATSGRPTVRSLPLAFPDDPGALDLADSEYLLGPDLLIAPVIDAGVTSRKVHVPDGTWVHWFTGKRTKGRSDLEVDAPLGEPPVFARLGALVPLFNASTETLVHAKDASIMTLEKGLDHEARWFPDEGAISAVSAAWPYGDALAAQPKKSDGALSIDLAWTSPDGRGVVLTIDVGSFPLDAKKTQADGQVLRLTSESAVRAATGSAFAFDVKHHLLFVRVAPHGKVVLHG